MTTLERVKARIDPAEVARAERERVTAANAERREYLYGRLFRNVTPGRDVARLRTKDAALEMLRRAADNADNRLQVQILRVAVDNRWESVVNRFIRIWDGEHPIAQTVAELWSLTLTAGRDAV